MSQHYFWLENYFDILLADNSNSVRMSGQSEFYLATYRLDIGQCPFISSSV